MKFSRKLKKTDLFKRSSDQSRKKTSNRDLSTKINEVKNSKKIFRFSFIKNLTWHKKKDTSTIKLPIITPLSTPRIEKLENELMFTLKKINRKSKTQNYQQGKHSTLVDLFNLNNSFKETIEECTQYQTKSHANKRLLITRSIDDFDRTSEKRYLCSSFSSQSFLKSATRRPNHSDTSLTTIPRCRLKLPSQSIDNQKPLPSKISIKSESCLKKQNSPTHRKLSLHWDENSLKSTSKQDQPQAAAIIEFQHQSHLPFSKSLGKSHSSPLPINTNHSSVSNNHVQSAHMMDQYPYENKNGISLYSCVSEMGNDESTENISSDEESVQRRLLQYNKKSVRNRWSLFDIWRTTVTKLLPIFNWVWRKRLHRTGSREFLLECDQVLPTNHNNNGENCLQEQRYVEQERPIHSHLGLALFALLIFPPVGKLVSKNSHEPVLSTGQMCLERMVICSVQLIRVICYSLLPLSGILAIMLSIWSLSDQQDRHLSRKFGNAVYWISILAICLSFLLLFILFLYFTYQYLINRSIIINRHLTTARIRLPITKDFDYVSFYMNQTHS